EESKLPQYRHTSVSILSGQQMISQVFNFEIDNLGPHLIHFELASTKKSTIIKILYRDLRSIVPSGNHFSCGRDHYFSTLTLMSSTSCASSKYLDLNLWLEYKGGAHAMQQYEFRNIFGKILGENFEFPSRFIAC
ncbi:hypothetical protein ACJX0J_007807, partial [Zea mays]